MYLEYFKKYKCMSYKSRFVQAFVPERAKDYLTIEEMFHNYEQVNLLAPKGTRYILDAGEESSNILIWECEFPNLEELIKAKDFLMNDNMHAELLALQSQYIISTHIEIYKPYKDLFDVS